MAIATIQLRRKHTEGTQSVIDRDENNILIHEMVWSVIIHSATAAHEPTAAVNEKHYWF